MKESLKRDLQLKGFDEYMLRVTVYHMLRSIIQVQVGKEPLSQRTTKKKYRKLLYDVAKLKLCPILDPLYAKLLILAIHPNMAYEHTQRQDMQMLLKYLTLLRSVARQRASLLTTKCESEKLEQGKTGFREGFMGTYYVFIIAYRSRRTH